MRETPQRGIPYHVSDVETIIPTYVAESETPRADGGCLTHDLTRGPNNEARKINASGWFVEYHYPNDTPGIGKHRRFIPFNEEG